MGMGGRGTWGRSLSSSSQHDGGTGSEKWLDSRCILKSEEKALGIRSMKAHGYLKDTWKAPPTEGEAVGAAAYGGAAGARVLMGVRLGHMQC